MEDIDDADRRRANRDAYEAEMLLIELVQHGRDYTDSEVREKVQLVIWHLIQASSEAGRRVVR